MVIPQKATENLEIQEKVKFLLGKLNIDYVKLHNYILAFIHRSIVNERTDFAPEHNERLEYLGDAVLELCITEMLFLNFPKKQEGELTDMRSALVRGRNLSEISKNLGFQNFLLLGKGEEKGGGRENDYILANTLEAFIGALYLDKGFEEAHNFIKKYIYITLDHIQQKMLLKDFKTLLQEYTQAQFDITPKYNVLSENGPDHDKNFLVGVYLNEKCIGEGTGSSKKKAQEKAAENAYISFNL